MPIQISKSLNSHMYNFIWRNKPHYLRKDILLNSKQNGGLEVLDYEYLNYSFKVNWFIKLLRNKDSIWRIFPNFIFKEVGGIEFLLKCNYSIDKLPIKLSNFHRQALSVISF